MKRLVSLLILLGAIAAVGVSLLPPKNTGAFDIIGFGRLPVLANGRIKPLDTVARSSLLQLQSRQEVRILHVEDPVVGSPTEWLLDVFYRPERADTYQTFAVDHLEQPEVMAVIGQTPETLHIKYDSAILNLLAIADMVPKTQRRFSFNELAPHLEGIEEQAKLAAPVENAVRTPFQRSVLQLYANLRTYVQLKHALVIPGRPDFLGDVMHLQEKLPEIRAAADASEKGQPHDEAALNGIVELIRGFRLMKQMSTLLVAPPDNAEPDITHWQTAGAALFDTFDEGRVNSATLAYAGLGHAWRAEKPAEFNQLLTLFRHALAKRFGPQLDKGNAEARFNAIAPFYTSMLLYAAAFFAAIFSWLFWPEALGRLAFRLVGLAWLVATAGIFTRMWLEGRPPVTNLYSSALFIGWGATGLCLLLEYFYRNAVGSVAAGIVGFITLIIAHHLSLSGDTLEMMRAVLDTNLWLATHVVIVTTGYAATFLAGFLALIYIVMGLATKWLSRAPASQPATAGAPARSSRAGATATAGKRSETNADMIGRMVYGIVCFATLCSFTGTVLGGIWADQSWGRFWGWDPKENGALLIVIWNAIILHARWGGMIKQRGLMVLAVGGNIVTSWSWFGTNMLGIGLHSYGFTDAAFVALIAFVSSQLVLIALANLPLSMWRSFRSAAAPRRDRAGADSAPVLTAK